MILENARRRIKAASLHINNASRNGVSNAIKSSYYMSASILLCSVVEGLTHELAKKHSVNNGDIISHKTDYTEKLKIKSGIIGNQQPLYICEKSKINIKINDEGANFGKLIIFLKNNHKITEQEYLKLNRIRKERNKIHIQSLTLPDTGHTKLKINQISSVINLLAEKL